LRAGPSRSLDGRLSASVARDRIAEIEQRTEPTISRKRGVEDPDPVRVRVDVLVPVRPLLAARKANDFASAMLPLAGGVRTVTVPSSTMSSSSRGLLADPCAPEPVSRVSPLRGVEVRHGSSLGFDGAAFGYPHRETPATALSPRAADRDPDSVKSGAEEPEMKSIATVFETVARVVRPGTSTYPALANVMHTRPIFERPA